MTERHVVTGVEPVWTRVTYEHTAEGVEQTTDAAFEEWVDRSAAAYECSCGAVIEGYGAMVEHLESESTT